MYILNPSRNRWQQGQTSTFQFWMQGTANEKHKQYLYYLYWSQRNKVLFHLILISETNLWYVDFSDGWISGGSDVILDGCSSFRVSYVDVHIVNWTYLKVGTQSESMSLDSRLSHTLSKTRLGGTDGCFIHSTTTFSLISSLWLRSSLAPWLCWPTVETTARRPD